MEIKVLVRKLKSRVGKPFFQAFGPGIESQTEHYYQEDLPQSMKIARDKAQADVNRIIAGIE